MLLFFKCLVFGVKSASGALFVAVFRKSRRNGSRRFPAPFPGEGGLKIPGLAKQSQM
jgi:hypothetical protein